MGPLLRLYTNPLTFSPSRKFLKYYKQFYKKIRLRGPRYIQHSATVYRTLCTGIDMSILVAAPEAGLGDPEVNMILCKDSLFAVPADSTLEEY
jgi:hypothetical protein